MGSYNDCRYNWFKRAVGDRFFTEFDEVAQSYILTDSQVDTSGDTIFIEADFVFTGFSGLRNLIGLNTSDPIDAFGLRIEENVIKFYSSGFTPGQGTTNIADGKLHRVSANINKNTGVFEVVLDGSVEYTGTHTATSRLRSLYYVSVGARANSFGGTIDTYYNGIISNAKIKSDSTTVLDMRIDQNYTPTNNTVIDRASGNNGTFVNVADGDSTFYQLINGQWVDENGDVLEIAYPSATFMQSSEGEIIQSSDNKIVAVQ